MFLRSVLKTRNEGSEEKNDVSNYFFSKSSYNWYLYISSYHLIQDRIPIFLANILHIIVLKTVLKKLKTRKTHIGYSSDPTNSD